MKHGSFSNFPEYKLAEKMKSRFSGRGTAVSGMQASTTSELMKRAQMGGDPSVNCSELDFRNGRNVPNNPNSGYRPAYMNNPVGYGQTGRQNTRSQDPGYAAKENGRPVQNGADAQARSTASRGYAANAGAKTHSAQKPKRKAKTTVQNPVSSRVVEEISELKVEGRRMTPMFAVILLIGTMMVMSIVLSFSEIYQNTSQMAQLETDLANLKDIAADLELKLDEKNDIRVIEQLATEHLGMVKEDAVQRKYLSLSDGERIEVLENETAESDSGQAFGVLLSSIWSSLGSLFDYFR